MAMNVSEKGKTSYFCEAIISVGCIMDFSVYPFDSHTCKFIMGSTGFSESYMTFKSGWSVQRKQRPLQYRVLESRFS